jgi:hypothetical protein
MMLGSEFEMMSGFTMSVGGFFVEFVVVFRFVVVVVGHISVVFGVLVLGCGASETSERTFSERNRPGMRLPPN